MAGVIVEIGARRFAVPFECPCCGAGPDTELIVALTPTKERPVAPETARELGFPYCRKCVAHSLRWESSRNLETGVKVFGLLVGILVGLITHVLIGLGIFVVAVVLSILLGRARRRDAQAACGPACSSPGLAVAYLGWSGNASTLSFESHVYAARFAEQNVAKLVNVAPQLRQVMDGHKLARLAVPTPAAAIRTVPAAAKVEDWIARVDRATTRVERLDILQRALDALPAPGDRERLISACRVLELAPIIVRLDRLTGTARVRQLQQEIVEIRADNIPDELRDALLRELEARM